MARPKSQDKRNAILVAAIELIAGQGLSVPTAKIAHAAGVAEGTLFTYFETKERLLNELYLELKREEREEMTRDYPVHASLKARARYVWDNYVGLGIAQPHKFKAMTQLSVSDHIWEQTKRQSVEGFEAISAMLQECLTSGALKDQPHEFGVALFISMRNMTIEFMLHHPSEADRFRDAGFTAFWNAVTTT
ncbi:TetR/AcrR family transcriptional regulator [Ktedonobacter racemifer]|uniref:Transcriptional regulator, TetR family n=1 Tax=Ktedonobacter racemifer DSM 44963 TaxID=485913 RepID=D6TS63_KTERA|nr:TetR/AcrR family transcriptional regulator [Ktedonobacter racemifer]EFH86136.1 transcriptional regulator, TetR family [Ktedonobacter racemifer DSM 44963]